MTNYEKKELFLQIIETWFGDYSEQIKSDNCIGFYNYLLDCLEFEAQFSPDHEFEFHVFLYDFIDLLSNFPDYKEQLTLKKGGLKETMFNYSDSTNSKNLSVFLEKLNELFVMIKDEYFL